MHTSIQEWWVDNGLVGDVDAFVQAKTGLANPARLNNFAVDLTPDSQNTWKTY
jgi:hypothetical protein